MRAWLLVTTLSVAAGCDRDAPKPEARPTSAPVATSAPPKDDCLQYRTASSRGRVELEAIEEASGLVASRRHAGVLWVHNDSGDTARFFAIKDDGSHLGIFRLADTAAFDWEDLAIGPGPEKDRDYLYLGDIGDNKRVRDTIEIHRVAEPDPQGGTDRDAGVELTDVETFTLDYAGGEAHDAETLFVDPRNQDLYIVTKNKDTGLSHVFRAQAPLRSGATLKIARVASLKFGTAPLGDNPSTTGGDISADGNLLVIKTYTTAFVWRRGPKQTIVQALEGVPCPVPLAEEPQGESIAFTPDGMGYFTLSERTNQPIHFFPRAP